MDTLDNANNPFGIPSISNKTDDEVGLFDDLKKNEDDLIKMLEKSNCEDRLSDCTDTTTDIDNIDIDRSISPNIDIIKHQTNDNIDKNQNFNPFNDIEKSLEINLNLKEGTFDLVSPSEENCQLPNNSDIHNVSQLIDAGAESDSEEDEEWNYVRGEEANKENTNPLIELKSEEKDEMSQLNPDAAEFVPESPTRNIVSPLGRVLNDELVLSESPKKPPINDVDLNVPSCVEFDKDISEKPHETIDVISNGHQNNLEETNNTGGSNNKFDEFHFGPNATPFTPNKFLDKSEASSTRAVFGDESALNCSFNDSNFDCDQTDFLTTNDDPMSMSFHQDRLDDSNPFDLNKVHQLPDDVDEFIKSGDDTNPLINDTISDLDEHFPLGKPEETKPIEQEQEEKLIEQDVEQIIESKEQEEIVEKHQTEEPETHQEIYQTFESEIHQIVQPEIHQIMEPLEDDDEPKILCDLKEKVDDSDDIPMKENKQDFEEKEISSSSEKEQESLNEDIVTSFMDDTSKDIERVADLIEEAKVFCDKIESTELFEPVTAEASPNNDEFVCFKTEKCEQEMAKEENVLIHTEECLIPSPTINQSNPFIEDTTSVEQIIEKEVTENKPQDEILLEFDVKTDSEQPTPESDQQLINNVDVIPINAAPTSDVNLLTDFQPPVISNEQIIEPSDNIVDNTPEVSFTSISHNITSTPCGDKTEESLIQPLSSTIVDEIIEIIPKITLEEASPKPETPKDEKKVTKSKATPSSTTKKTPTPRTPLSSKTSATSSKSTTPRSTKPLTPKVSSTTKTETTAPKPITKSATKTTTTAAKPLTSARLKPPSKPMESKNLTNGEVKPKTTGTIKKLPEVSSARSTTSSTTTKTSSTTARVPLTARATTAPKPKPTTLKPTAPVKTTTTTATTKPSTTVRSTVPSRVPSASSKPATTSTVKAPLSKTISKPKTTVEKQTKETANKLTASKTLKSTTTTTQARNLTATKRSDEKVTGTSTRTVTSTRTAATTKITAKKDTTTKTSLTKVGKPKENGVASVVTETIIVNNTTNGLNGGEQYVKDNSPIDNKLIVDTIENTAN